MIGPLWSNSGNARSRRHVTDELTHDSLVVWLKLSCYVGNGLKGLGAAEEIQQHCKHKQKHMREFAQRPQNHYPRNVEASTTSPKNRTSAPWLPASWNERSRPKPRRFKHLRRFLIFWFFEIHREIASVSNGSLRFEKQVGDEPTSKSMTSEVAFWRYSCKGFGDTRRFSCEAWARKALWLLWRSKSQTLNPKPVTRNP